MQLRRLILTAVLALAAGLARADDPSTAPAYWGAPSVDGGKCCRSLAEVRDHIDGIDKQILTLMAERGRYVAEAGRFKKDPAAVSAPARVEAILTKVKALAAESALSPDVAERTYRAMIAAFEDYERAEWSKRNLAPAQ